MKIKSLLVMPGKEVQIVRIPASIKYMKSLLGGDIYKITLNENTAIIASRNVKIEEFNRIEYETATKRLEIFIGTD